MASSNYWLAIAVHTFVAAQWGPQNFSRKTEIATHLYASGWPMLLVIIGLATKLIRGANGLNPYGYFLGGTVEHPFRGWPEFPLYYGWLLLNICVVFLCLGWVLSQSILV
jgi:hypothetical protein